MMLNLSPLLIDPETIDATRRLSLNQDLPLEIAQPLLESIGEFGIIHPPIVRRSGTSYEAVCGSKRIAAARQLSLKPITCMVLNHTVDESNLLMLIAEDQNLSGALSPIQTARLTVMADRFALQQNREYMQRLTRISSSSKRQQLKRLLDLDEAIRNSIHEGRCSVQTGVFLLELNETDRSILFHVVSKLSLNTNKQRRVIELSRIISALRQCSIGDVFKADYPEILDKQIDNIPQKTALMLKNLYRQSHPLSMRAEERFYERLKMMNLPAHCRLTHSPYFEQDTVTLEIDFFRFEDFENRWEEIKRLWR